MVNKLKLYNSATEKLVTQVRDLKLPDGFSTKYNMEDTVYLIREGFKIKDIREQVLSQKYEKERFDNYLFSSGFCGIASYIWNHLYRMSDGSEIFILNQISNNKNGGLQSHVWNINIFDNKIFDLTFDQSVNSKGVFLEIPYQIGNSVNSDFEFIRAKKFAEFIGINIEK